MFSQTSRAVQAAILRAGEEASRRGDRRMGTDHLLIGLLHDPAIAARLGTTVEQARTIAWNLDRQALATLGLDLGEVPSPPTLVAASHHAPTSGMRTTLAQAFTIAKNQGRRRIEPRHVLAALLERDQPDPAAVLLHTLSIQASTSDTHPPSTEQR